MSFTVTSITILDSTASSKSMIAYTNGTSEVFAHALLDSTGAIVDPASSTLQGAANSSLSQIVTAVQAAIPAGANIIGNVRIDQTTPGTTNGVQVNAALPAGSNVIGAVTISALATTIGKVSFDQTSSATNGVFLTSGVAIPAPLPNVYTGGTVTRPGNATAYSAGQLVYSTTATGQLLTTTCQVTTVTGQAFTILKSRLFKSSSGTTNAVYRMHYFNQQPTLTSGDGATFVITSGGWLGSTDVTVNQPFSVGAAGIGAPTVGSTIAGTPVAGTIYVYVAIEARATYTPVSGEVYTPIVEMQ